MVLYKIWEPDKMTIVNILCFITNFTGNISCTEVNRQKSLIVCADKKQIIKFLNIMEFKAEI